MEEVNTSFTYTGHLMLTSILL